ncbi:MAG: hypothetical protein IT382_23890 [Deltaproteobacteria bacterium]|nr:hypothetical protein [Deltaproteobacteria bacterium]
MKTLKNAIALVVVAIVAAGCCCLPCGPSSLPTGALPTLQAPSESNAPIQAMAPAQRF